MEVLKIVKQKFDVEIRCEMLKLVLELQLPKGKVDFSKIVGYNSVFDRVKSHHICRFISATEKHSINIYAQKLIGMGLWG